MNPTETRRHRSFDRGGDRNYDSLSPAAKDAHDFLAWTTEEGLRRDPGARARYAGHAARHLKATAPDRFNKAVASWKAGRGTAVYDALVALADEAAAAR